MLRGLTKGSGKFGSGKIPSFKSAAGSSKVTLDASPRHVELRDAPADHDAPADTATKKDRPEQRRQLTAEQCIAREEAAERRKAASAEFKAGREAAASATTTLLDASEMARLRTENEGLRADLRAAQKTAERLRGVEEENSRLREEVARLRVAAASSTAPPPAPQTFNVPTSPAVSSRVQAFTKTFTESTDRTWDGRTQVAEEAAVKLKLEGEEARGECSFLMLSAEFILAWPTGKELPDCSTIQREHPGKLTPITVTQGDAYRGAPPSMLHLPLSPQLCALTRDLLLFVHLPRSQAYMPMAAGWRSATDGSTRDTLTLIACSLWR